MSEGPPTSVSPPPDSAADSPPAALPGGLRDSEVGPARHSIAEILDRLPTSPGVYLMKDRRGKAVYIGKAANLRARVRQYFQPGSGDNRLFIPLLDGIVVDIETVLTHNEKEALLLENTLIKRHQPRFNINLRDDKNYLVLRLDPEAPWPRLEVVRKIAGDGAYYFGPYHSASSCREALRVVNRHFQLRTCTDHVLANRRRPCLQYQIKRCPAPCVLEVSRDDYGDAVRDVRYFLEGKDDELVARLQARMRDAATRTEFERAAAIRDQLHALEVTLESQRVVSTDFVDQDVIGLHREGMALEIVVMVIRQGKLVGNRVFSFGGQEFPDSELLSSFVGLLYDSATAPIPDEILLPMAIDDGALKEDWLTERRPPRRRRVEIVVPQRGDRKRLVDLAEKNARASFASRRNAREDTEVMLAKLQKRLRLPRLPRVIECYDISHIQGFAPVASRVLFVDGRPDRSRYRTYRIRGVETSASRRGNDDFASMYEVLSRRFRRARQGDVGWELPDLIVIDGGKGQLGMALAAARDCEIDVRPGQGLPIIGLAKERDFGGEDAASAVPGPDVRAAGEPPQGEAPVPAPSVNPAASAPATPDAVAPLPTDSSVGTRPSRSRKPSQAGQARLKSDADAQGRRPDRIFLPNAKDAIAIRPNSAEMFVLQHLRDEAHRFAVSFHRRRRGQLTLRSVLSDVAGIGHTRQRALLRHFGSLKKIREATLEELSAVAGMNLKVAAAVLAHLGIPRPPGDGAVASASGRATPSVARDGSPGSEPGGEGEGAAAGRPPASLAGGDGEGGLGPSAARSSISRDPEGGEIRLDVIAVDLAGDWAGEATDEAADEALESAFAAIEEEGDFADEELPPREESAESSYLTEGPEPRRANGTNPGDRTT